MASRAWACILVFQSTRPAWGRDLLGRFAWLYLREVSIHAPRVGARRIAPGRRLPAGLVSIHAPRVGARRGCYRQSADRRAVSIHASRVGSRTVNTLGAWTYIDM